MESLQNLKKRLKTVGNIKQITKAMELVAATKMRKSQEIAINSRPYSLAVLDLLSQLSKMENIQELSSLFQKRQVIKTLFVVICSDKGLVGSFNSTLLRKLEWYFRENKLDFKDENFSFLAIGEKTNNFLLKKGGAVLKKFTRVGDFTSPSETKPIADFLAIGYLKKHFDKVVVFSTHFRNAFKQDPLMQEILPIDSEKIKEIVSEITPTTGKFAEIIKEQKLSFYSNISSDYLIEPSPKQAMIKLAEHLLSMQIYHLILETNASEHSAKRMAMKNASDNASQITSNLTLVFNKSRQAKITQEILEVMSGSNN